jgi:hypothetical protein
MRKFLFIFCFSLTACATGFEEFYESTVSEEGFSTRYERSSEPPEIVASYGDASETVVKMFEKGFGLVGYSAFNGPIEESKKALSKAKEVGATKVVILAEYTNTVNGTISIPGSNQVTTYHSGTISAYGTGGSAYGSYSGTSTSYVPTTNNIPYSVTRYDQTALFFAILKPSCLGIMVSEPSDAEKRMVGTNKVVKVAAVRQGSVAYHADVLSGDLIATTGAKGLDMQAKFYGVKRGVSHTLRIVRGRQIIETEVLPQYCS